MSIDGFVVKDAVIKQKKNGEQYMSFRFVNKDWSTNRDSTGKVKPCYFTITSSIPKLIKLAQYIKKGKSLCINGNFSYQPNNGLYNDGEPYFYIDATSITFSKGGASKKFKKEEMNAVVEQNSQQAPNISSNNDNQNKVLDSTQELPKVVNEMMGMQNRIPY